jgi:hypothetical protein
MRIAIATCRPMPEPDPDEPLLLDALREAGHEPKTLAWNDSPDVLSYDAVLLRSTWDYYHAPDAFRAWLMKSSAQARLVNPLTTVLSNLHKSYLLELRARGVPTVPTVLIAQGTEIGEYEGDPSSGLVVKPAVGAGSWKTRVFTPDQTREALGYAQGLARELDVLIQPYLSRVQQGGERSLVWIDGRFTHKVTKRPRFEGHEESVSDAEPLTEHEAAIGRRAMDGYVGWTMEQPLYGRVDVMEADDGGLLVSEVELIEPSLYFLQEPLGLDAFVRALGRYLS